MADATRTNKRDRAKSLISRGFSRLRLKEPSGPEPEAPPLGDRDDAKDLRRSGTQAYKDGNFAVAAGRLQRAVELAGNDRWAWLWLARARLRIGEMESARAAAKRALAVSPDWFAAIDELARSSTPADAGDTVAILHRYALEHGTDPALLRRVLRHLKRLNALPETLDVAEAVLALEPTDEQMRSTAAWALARSGRDALFANDPAKARGYLERAIQFADGDRWTWVWLARAHRRLGEMDAARAAVERALAISPNWQVALADRERLQRAEKPEVAAELTVERKRESATAKEYVELGREAFKQREYDSSREWLERAVAIVDSNVWAWLWLSRARIRLGDAAESSQAARRVLELRPNWLPGIEALAESLVQDGNQGDALALLRDALITRADDPAILLRLLQKFKVLRTDRDTQAKIEALLRLDPTNEELIALRVEALVELGDVAGSEVFLADALTKLSSPQAARLLAHHHRLRGEWREAWFAVKQGNISALDLTSLRAIANGLSQLGEISAAASAFEIAASRKLDDLALQKRFQAVASEARVMRGEWHPPAIDHHVIDPIPGRVLHVVGQTLPYAQTGYTIRTQSVVQAQRHVGLDPQVVSQYGFPWKQGKDAPLWEEIGGIPYHRLPPGQSVVATSEEQLSRHALGLADLVRRLRPAVLHAASDFRNANVAINVGAAFGIPVVYEVRGFWEESWLSRQMTDATEAELYGLRRSREIDAARRADRIVTLSRGMRDELGARGVPDERITIVPNAVDVDAFTPVEADPELRSRLGIAENEIVLGYISSFSAYEGIQYLIEAIALLAARGLPVRGLLVGDGAEMENLKAHANRLGMADRIVFTGRVPHTEVLGYYGLIDIFVVPRTADRVSQLVTPLKPFEAMATARAVVVSSVDALREMVVEGQTGLVFQPENAQDLADVVAPLVGDPARRKAMGQAARAWVSEHRTWAQNGRRYLRLYQEMGIPLPPALMDA